MGNNTRSNPDDRRDNVEKIEYNIGKTIQNMKRAEERTGSSSKEDR